MRYLWPTPVGIFDLKSRFQNFETSTKNMIDDMPIRTKESNLLKVWDIQAYKELQTLVKECVIEYTKNCKLGEELVFFDAFVNEYKFGEINSPHSHACAKAFAIYFIQGLGKNHGDLLLHDPRGGVDWDDVIEETSRGNSGRRTTQHIPTVSGTLIIAPAYVIHSVEPNMLEQSRITLGINLYSKDFLKNFNPDI